MRSLLVIAVLAALILGGGFLSFAFMHVEVPQKEQVVSIPVPSATPEAPPAVTPIADAPSVPPAVPPAVSPAVPAPETPAADAGAPAAPATDE